MFRHVLRFPYFCFGTYAKCTVCSISLLLFQQRKSKAKWQYVCFTNLISGTIDMERSTLTAKNPLVWHVLIPCNKSVLASVALKTFHQRWVNNTPAWFGYHFYTSTKTLICPIQLYQVAYWFCLTFTRITILQLVCTLLNPAPLHSQFYCTCFCNCCTS